MMPSCADFHGLWSLLLRFSSVWAALGQARQLQVACLIPGHYEAGMRGSIDGPDWRGKTSCFRHGERRTQALIAAYGAAAQRNVLSSGASVGAVIISGWSAVNRGL